MKPHPGPPTESSPMPVPKPHASVSSIRRALLRGLGVVLPPLLTIVVMIWAWNLIENYVLRPVETGIREVLVWQMAQIETKVPAEAVVDSTSTTESKQKFTYQGIGYQADPTGRRYLPSYVVEVVDADLDNSPGVTPPQTAKAYWDRYVQIQYMPRTFVVPVFLMAFFSILYFLGRLFTGGIGRWFVMAFDSAILRIPIVNKVYGSVKQITDFAFDERQIQFNRVVAIQYPCHGVWSIGFVTGNSMQEIADAAGEPMLSLLMPTSPMPMTGFTVSVRRSDAIDLNLTIDEAIQFIVSCGVVTPLSQRPEIVAAGAVREKALTA